MAPADDPANLGLIAAGRQLRAGTLSSRALTEACLARIEARNSALGAFITVTAASALEDASAADRELLASRDRGPLHGIPISLKDLIDQAGVPTTAGSAVPNGTPAVTDAVVTSRLRAAGAVLIGKTNLHEFALGTTSTDSAFGVVHHPDDVTRSAGGSSGGSAVAVRTGMSIASVGTDTGGSIRIPSAVCGLVGLKPAFGEVPRDGIVPLSGTFDHVGPLARTVDAAAALYQVLARLTPRTPVPRDVSGLRLARLTGYMEATLEPGVRASYEAAIEQLARSGATISDAVLPHAEDIPAIYLHVCLPEGAAYHARTLEACPERYRPATRMRLEQGRYILAEDYLRALAGCAVLRREVDRALAEVDALVLPGCAIAAPALDADTVMVDGVPLPVRAQMLRLTQPFNLTGHPAIVLPCGLTPEGLPVSLQLVAPHHGTSQLLDIAAGVERLLAKDNAELRPGETP